MGFPGDSVVKESPGNAGDEDLILSWEHPLEESMANHSTLLAWRILMDRGAWWATVESLELDATEKGCTHARPSSSIGIGL